jgi:thiol-disulfide isomerase/thioredoxin
MSVSEASRMPAFEGASEWINSEPLGPDELRGRAVLVNFWTLTCINWLRAQPYVREWSRVFGYHGLVVIGVHTPEFSFERDVSRVRQAVNERAIDYPVVLDNDYEIWQAFGNEYWPALYFVDQDGIIRDRYFGEGHYEQSERLLKELLGVTRKPIPVEGLGVEAEAYWAELRSPETYLGHKRAERFASPGGAALDERRAYELPERLPLNHWALSSEWTIGPEKVVLDRAGGSIAIRFHARDVHLVLCPEAYESIPFRVLVDGEPPGWARGEDVDEEGNGVLTAGRLYQLVRQHGVIRERTMEVSFDAPGAEAYVFTFG